MATSGNTFGTVSQNSSRFRSGVFWYRTAVDPINNFSDIYIYSYVDTTSTSYTFSGTCSAIWLELGTNGAARYRNNFANFTWATTAGGGGWNSASNSPAGRAWKECRGMTYRVYHDANGNASVNGWAHYSCAAGTYGPGEAYIASSGYAFDLYLDQIDRSPSTMSNLTATALSDTMIQMNWNESQAIDWAQYMLNDSGTWVDLPWSATYGNYIPNLTSGTTYKIAVRTRRTYNQVWNGGSQCYGTTNQAPFVGLSINGGAMTFKPIKVVRPNGTVKLIKKTDIVKVSKTMRYIVVGSQGSTANIGNHIVECQAFVGTTNVALNKTVTSNIVENPSYPLSRVTNGNTATEDWPDCGSRTVVDLGQEYVIDKVKLWRYYGDGRTYYCTYCYGYNANWELVWKFHDYIKDGQYAETSSGREMIIQ